MGSHSSKSPTVVGGAPVGSHPITRKAKRFLRVLRKDTIEVPQSISLQSWSRQLSKRSNWNALRRSIASSTIGRSVAARCTIKRLARADLGENCPPKLSQLKPAEKWLYDFDSQMLEQALADLQRAYVHFFPRRAKFPKFKKKRSAREQRWERCQKYKSRRLENPRRGTPGEAQRWWTASQTGESQLCGLNQQSPP